MEELRVPALELEDLELIVEPRDDEEDEPDEPANAICVALNTNDNVARATVYENFMMYFPFSRLERMRA